MNEFLAEAIGTFILILFGCGVNAGTSLNKSLSNRDSNSWVVGTLGWGLAVTLGVYASGKFSGAHINPAVTLGFLSIGEIEIRYGKILIELIRVIITVYFIFYICRLFKVIIE